MRLEIDAGNTRVKWRLVSDSAVQSAGAVAYTDVDDLALLWQQIELPVGVMPESVSVANVAGVDVLSSLSRYSMDRWQLMPREAYVTAHAAGVENAYADYARLGVDRWLAVLAAFHKAKGAHLVVDCGSAVTVDLITAAGRHLGGYIVPGLRLMRRALFRDTDAVKVMAAQVGDDCAPGKNTEDAVNRGLPLMVVGLVAEARRRLLAEGEQQVNVWLTGGDGEQLVSLLSGDAVFCQDLVLEGLAYAQFRQALS